MHNIGYSTGAVALGDFSRAIEILRGHQFQAIELSALRIHEVEPLIHALPRLDLRKYAYISFHAPSSFEENEEQRLIDLFQLLPAEWPIVLHPDAIHSFERWQVVSDRLAIENMDRRKSTGRSVRELLLIFERLPRARMCLDIGHARQVDTSMMEAYSLLKTFSDRIVQLHVSEVDSMSRHDAISLAGEMAFRQLRKFIPDAVPIILEGRVNQREIDQEAHKVTELLALKWNKDAVPA